MLSRSTVPNHSKIGACGSTILQFRKQLAHRELSVQEAVTSYFERADRNRHLNIYITEARDLAIEQARRSDERIAKGLARPLEGIPFAVKDNYCTKDIRTTAGSKMLEHFIPTYESTVTQKLLNAGAVILGKTNMDEFAMGSSTESSFFGPTINPVGERMGISNLVPGGSSGGSAAAVAANLAIAALGTDTGGSIRQPASFCGIFGFKPTYGTCSRWGIIAYASSLDQAGVLGKSVSDIALVMDVIAGDDPNDATSLPAAAYDFKKTPASRLNKIKIGIPKEVVKAGSTPDAETVWRSCYEIEKLLNAEICEVSIPNFRYALPAYYILALSEAASNLARYDGVRYGYRAERPRDILELYDRTRREAFGAEVKRRIILGTFALSAGYYEAYYLRAQRIRKLIAEEFAAAFLDVDFLFMPTAPTAAFSIGAHSADPVTMYLEDVYTVAVNLAGLPAISIPIARNNVGLPLGLQIVGKQFSDHALIQTSAAIEQVIGLQ